jgi:hypothetical protein
MEEYTFDIEAEGLTKESLLSVVARVFAPLTEGGERMTIDVEDDEGGVVVMVGRDDDEPMADEDGELTSENVMFSVEGDLLTVTLLSDDPVRVELLRADLEGLMDG